MRWPRRGTMDAAASAVSYPGPHLAPRLVEHAGQPPGAEGHPYYVLLHLIAYRGLCRD
ncbi:hypothetical protein [Amycolatopsis sp. CA-128772]|uniref:hypothetical protein n=1 Tax=Amycolatopsis sp. CA-128772 TaxID=2073159 RepID=UPI00130484E2|nr:hypothetical protein [Amycolatopsis sp. CA-128772]